MTLNQLRLQYISAKELSHKPDYWKERLMIALEKAISYEQGPAKTALIKELFNLK